MGRGKVQVVRALQSCLKPGLLRHIDPRIQPGCRSRLEECAVLGQEGNVADAVLVVVVEERKIAVYRFSGQVRIFYHSIIQGIRKLHDRAQVGINRPVHLCDHRLVLLPNGSGQLPGKPPIQGNADQKDRCQGAYCKINIMGCNKLIFD